MNMQYYFYWDVLKFLNYGKQNEILSELGICYWSFTVNFKRLLVSYSQPFRPE